MKFQVDTARLESEVDSMSQDVESLKNHAAAVQRALSELDGMWAGAAHDEFVVQRDNDYRVLTTFLDSLQKGISQMGKARQQYDTCEENVKARIRSIRV